MDELKQKSNNYTISEETVNRLLKYQLKRHKKMCWGRENINKNSRSNFKSKSEKLNYILKYIHISIHIK
jgi:hypothetical protein